MNCSFKPAALHFLLLFLTLILTGCSSSDMAPAMPRSDTYAPRQVVFSSQDLADSIAIGKIQRTFDSAGLMHLNIPLRATTELSLTVDYRLTYFDDEHNPVDVPTGWQTKTLTPNLFESIQASGFKQPCQGFSTRPSLGCSSLVLAACNNPPSTRIFPVPL